MSCRDLINSRWTVGGDFRALQKKFAKFDNVIPGLYVKIVHGGCDIEGWTLRAYFKKPGATESDPCLYLDGIVSNDEVIFDLKGTLFGEFGVWEVSLVLNGLGISPNKESIASNNSITYEVIKNCEGLEAPPIPPQSTQNTVDELIIKLQNKIDEANMIVNATSIFSTNNVLKDTDVDTGVSIDNLKDSTELYFSLDTTNAQNIPYTAYKEAFVQSLKGSNEYRITEKSGNSNAVEDEVSLSFYLNDTTNTIHYKVDWGSNVIAEGIDIIAYERSGTINDLLEKGAGYDSSKYPNGKAITNAVESNEQNITNLGNDKVDKVVGKGLSENDYTDIDKNIVSDALVKGTGFNSVKYPNGKAITDVVEGNTKQIQNCYIQLGTETNPLVGIVSAGDGALYKVRQDGQLCQGLGTTFGSDNGFSGIINKEDGSVQIGEGYENLFYNATESGVKATYLGNLIWELEKQTNSLDILAVTGDRLKLTNYTVSWEFLDGFVAGTSFNDSTSVTFGSGAFGATARYREKENTITKECVNIDTSSGVYVQLGHDLGIGYKVKIKIQLTESSEKLPEVEYVAPNGRLVIDGDLTEDYSYIGIGYDVGEGTNYSGILLRIDQDKNNLYLGYRPKISNLGKFKANWVYSSLFRKITDYETGVEIEDGGSGINNALTPNYITINTLRPGGSRSGVVNTFKMLLKYKGDLTEEQFNAELEKIKSGKYIIPQKFMGTAHNIPYMPKKADDNGITYEAVTVDENRDLEVLEKETRWEILKLSDDTVSYASVKKVNDIWTINGALDNVSGMIRTQYPAKVRRL